MGGTTIRKVSNFWHFPFLMILERYIIENIYIKKSKVFPHDNEQ